MKIIDQRILIPTAPATVWDYLQDISRLPEWQTDCQTLVFLSQRKQGPGVRWRYTSPNNSEYVLETTAWYDRLGFEYTYVEGVPFRNARGRIRLQEIAEGTVVQWTLTYEVGGPLGWVQNSLGLERQLEDTMVESLKQLWRKANQHAAGQGSHEAKSLMQDAPDAEARASYQPRHPSRVEDLVPETPLPHAQQANIVEPPLSDDDTRPNPTVTTEPAPTSTDHDAFKPPKREEPDFVLSIADLPNTPVKDEPKTTTEDTEPRPLPLQSAEVKPADEAVTPEDEAAKPLEIAPDAEKPLAAPTIEEPPRSEDDTAEVAAKEAPEETVDEAVKPLEIPSASTEATTDSPSDEAVKPLEVPKPEEKAADKPEAAPVIEAKDAQEEVKPEVEEPTPGAAPKAETVEVDSSPAEAATDSVKQAEDEPSPQPTPEAAEKSLPPKVEAAPTKTPVTTAPEPETTEKPSPLAPQPTSDAPKEPSIWEVFGVERPAEAFGETFEDDGERAAPSLPPRLDTLPEGPPLIDPHAPPRKSIKGVGGLRLALRRELVKVRKRSYD